MAKKILYFITKDDIAGINLALENQKDDVSILLIQNAVYFANKKCSEIIKALSENKKVFASNTDIELRGISNLVAEGIQTIDYSGIVDVVFDNDTTFNY